MFILRHILVNSIDDVQSNLSHSDAILRAVTRGFTVKSTSGNFGYGLDDLLNYVVRVNGGQVAIVSLEGHVLFCKRGNSVEYRAFTNPGYCPGTTIDITVRTDSIETVEEEPEELKW